MSNDRFSNFTADELEAICGQMAKDATLFLQADSPALTLYNEAKEVLEHKRELEELDFGDFDLGEEGCSGGGCVL